MDTVNSFVDITGIKAIESIPVILYKTNSEGQEYAFQTVSIKIMDARKLTKAVLSASKGNLNLEKDGTWYDSITLTLETTDQYGAGINPTGIVMSQTDVTKTNVGTLKIKDADWKATDKTGKFTYTVTGGAFTWADKIANDTTGAAAVQGGSIVLSVKVNNAVTTNNTGIAIADKTSVTAVAYIPTLSAASLDTSVTPDTKFSYSEFSVKKSKAGFDAGVTYGWFMSKDDFTAKNYAGLDVDDFVYTVSYNGGLINSADNFFDFADVLYAVTPTNDASGSALKAKAGTYVFTLYRVAVNNGDKYLTNFGSKTCVVSDAQINPVVTVKTDVSDFIGTPGNLALNVNLANSVLTVKWNGNDYATNVVKADVVKSRDNSDYIKSVTVKVPNTVVGNVFIEVPVNKLINGTNK
jgi:hypothetical protein